MPPSITVALSASALLVVNSALTVCHYWYSDLLRTSCRCILIRKCFNDDDIDANALEFLRTENGLIPAFDQGVGPRKDLDVEAVVADIHSSLNSGKCLYPADDGFALCVSAT